LLAGVGLTALLAMSVGTIVSAPNDTADPRRTVVVLGDSLAAGLGVEKEAAFPNLIQQRIDEAKFPFRVVNAGVSGDTTSGGLRRIDWLLRQKVDVLLLELGGNDGLRGIDPKMTKTNLRAIVDRTKQKYPEAKVIIAGMQMPPNMGKEYTDAFKGVFAAVAQETGSVLIPFLLEGIGADPAFNQDDLIHPNNEGHKIVAATIWKTLGPLLQEGGQNPGPQER
jgi:acyl-CoA thioesterase-1